MKLRIVSLALVAALVGAFVLGAASAEAKRDTTQVAGARGLVDAIVQLAADFYDNTVQVGLVNVNRSLNNLRALNNVLNNSPILSNNDIDVVDVIDSGDVNVTLTDVQIGILQHFLNDAQITALNNFLNDNQDSADVVVVVLSTGDLVLISR